MRSSILPILTSLFIVLCFEPANCKAQTTQTTQTQPATKLEAFASRTGIVVIRGFSTIGTMNGTGRVSVAAREFRNGNNPKQAEYGVTIEVKESGRLENESRSFIDQDEIDSLVKGIDYISKIDKSVSAMKDFEAEYRTKGDFSITIFSNSVFLNNEGGLGLAISSGRIGKATAFLKPSDLLVLRKLLVDAKEIIETAKQTVR
jgi:hypothetical protein